MAELSWRELEIERAVMARLDADREGYLELYDVEFGGSREYSADDAAELFPEYSESTEARTLNREAVGKAASWIAYTAFLRRLGEPGREMVVMTGGGRGRGRVPPSGHRCRQAVWCMTARSRVFPDAAG